MLTKHFAKSEMTCNCGCGTLKYTVQLMGVLEFIRARLMRPVIILSGTRCYARNAKCGGVENSQHLYGTAADIYVPGIDLETIARAARQADADGIGIYYKQNFVHVDCRGYKAEWNDL
jgi:uncharacterized protein YcbK (DUF882 family)